MEDSIRAELRSIEESRGIRIINARERGSRMLKVSHDKSDYDVMFLFAQEAPRYAMMSGYIGSIHEPSCGENGLIDLHGWNIDKFAGLLHDSNPNAIEYCYPTVEYIEWDNEVFEDVEREALNRFNHMSLYHHYISMAKSNYEKYIESGKDCTKGRQFYIARAIACAAHIRKDGTVPPMDVTDLRKSPALDDEFVLGGVLEKLAEAKRSGHGEDETPDITGPLYRRESGASMEPTDERIRSPDTAVLDGFIEEVLR